MVWERCAHSFLNYIHFAKNIKYIFQLLKILWWFSHCKPFWDFSLYTPTNLTVIIKHSLSCFYIWFRSPAFWRTSQKVCITSKMTLQRPISPTLVPARHQAFRGWPSRMFVNINTWLLPFKHRSLLYTIPHGHKTEWKTLGTYPRRRSVDMGSQN